MTPPASPTAARAGARRPPAQYARRRLRRVRATPPREAYDRRTPAHRLAAARSPPLALAGCGITDPYAGHHAAQRPDRTAGDPAGDDHGATVTDPSEPAPSQPATHRHQRRHRRHARAGAGDTPQALVARYARLYINWTATTIGAGTSASSPRSRSAPRAPRRCRPPRSYSHDPTLAASHVANTGTVVSIAAGQGPAARRAGSSSPANTPPASGDYAGLPAAAHVIYARVTHTPHGWVISEWSPQN